SLVSWLGSEGSGVIVFAVGSKSKSCVGPWYSGVSAAKITWPSGVTAPGVSSAPMPMGRLGPAVQVLVEGVYSAVLLLAPSWKTRPSGSRKAGPSSLSRVVELVRETGTLPASTQVLVEGR